MTDKVNLYCPAGFESVILREGEELWKNLSL